MASEIDHWKSDAYQHSASFVPKLATKIVQWLDIQRDDVILDVGCGDGVLDEQFVEALRHGKGRLHGIDSSESMIGTAQNTFKDVQNFSFEVVDATDIASNVHLQSGEFTKVFSNAAMHWILRPEATRATFFQSVRNALAPNGVFVFEMGGLGNVPEMTAAIMMAVARRVGIKKAAEVSPWFFPDEKWIKETMENQVGGWRVEKIEREWRPTQADKGGVDGWVRFMGQKFFEAVPESEREACIQEAVDVLRIVCANPSGGEMMSYARLRCVARKI